jgi:hypothetical protein
MRIQKFLSQQEICSRREAERWISEGRIEVNGKAVTSATRMFDPATDRIKVDGKSVKITSVAKSPDGGAATPLVYWLLHKPAGLALEKNAATDTIYQLPRLSRLSFKVKVASSLGKNSEGLCLLTNDEEFAEAFRNLENLEQTLLVMTDRRLEDEEIAKLLPAKTVGRPLMKIEYRHKAKLGATYGFWYFVQGNLFGMKRKLEAGLKRLKVSPHKFIQLSLAGVDLPEDLKPGDYVQLPAADLRRLKSMTRKKLPKAPRKPQKG